MGFFGRLKGALSKILGRGNNTPAQQPTDVEVTTTVVNNPPPAPVMGGGEQIAYPTDTGVEYLEGYKDRFGLVQPRWRIGYEGASEPTSTDVRDLINAIPNWYAYTVTVGGTRTNPYPGKTFQVMYLSFRVSSQILYEAAGDPDMNGATDFVNFFAEMQDVTAGWDEIMEVAIIDRIPDNY